MHGSNVGHRAPQRKPGGGHSAAQRADREPARIGEDPQPSGTGKSCMRMLLRDAALHQWLATAVGPVRNEQTVIGPVLVSELLAPTRQKQNLRRMRCCICACCPKQTTSPTAAPRS